MDDSDATEAQPDLLVRAAKIVEEAENKAVCLRLTGSLGIRSRCTERVDLFYALGRESYGDIDFIGRSKERAAINALFLSLGYEADQELVRMEEFGTNRLIFEQRDTGVKVDVFLDQLQMCHTLDFRKRLNLDRVTTSLVDLFLAKVQIHDITEKDLIDILVLLAEHPLGGGPEAINEVELLRRLGDDWGFYESATSNLSLAIEFVERWNGADLIKAELSDIVERVLQAIVCCSKTIRWRVRAKIGRSVPWYQEVEDVAR